MAQWGGMLTSSSGSANTFWGWSHSGNWTTSFPLDWLFLKSGLNTSLYNSVMKIKSKSLILLLLLVD